MGQLDNQAVVVIGGTSGIGLATAVAAAAEGARVFAASSSAEKVAAAGAAHPGITFTQVDVHDREGLASAFAGIGPVDHIVSAATGANRTTRPFLEQSDDQFRAAFEKFWGYNNVVRAGAPHLTANGSITLVSGIPARKCNPNMSSISCVGSAVEGLTRALAIELAPQRVNVVAPGIIDTGMFAGLGDNKAAMLAQMGKSIPLGRVGAATEVAAAIMLCVTNGFMTGATIDVDGGALLP
jgi:NAD(P)-dependent dehydrogenase (short-subunit alcohol dehydrogenase family)